MLWRAATGKCERVITPGTWLGIGPNIDHALIESTIALAEGDLLVLYTDGLTEAMTADHQQFGIARVEAIVERCRDRPTAEIEREILGAGAVDAEAGRRRHAGRAALPRRAGQLDRTSILTRLTAYEPSACRLRRCHMMSALEMNRMT